jgi:hypothetical protein
MWCLLVAFWCQTRWVVAVWMAALSSPAVYRDRCLFLRREREAARGLALPGLVAATDFAPEHRDNERESDKPEQRRQTTLPTALARLCSQSGASGLFCVKDCRARRRESSLAAASNNRLATAQRLTSHTEACAAGPGSKMQRA